MKKLYGSEVINETEWMDNKDEYNFRDAYMAMKKYQTTANGKKYVTKKWQWSEGSKVNTHTSRIG